MVAERQLSNIRRIVDELRASLEHGIGFDEQIAKSYQDAKRALALNMRDAAISALQYPETGLEEIKNAVLDQMERLFSGYVPPQFIKVGGYKSPQPDLYALLVSELGSQVPGWRFRLITADAVHTERRLRELRDLGLDVLDVKTGGEHLYQLTSVEPDLTYGAAFQLRKRARDRNVKGVTAADRYRAIELAETTATLPQKDRNDES